MTQNATVTITITAASDSKQYDGLPLISDGFTTSELPLGVTHVTATVEGSQADVGTSPNEVAAYTVWNGEQDVTAFFPSIVLEAGTLTVTPNATVKITITAASDSKEYDGLPLTNNSFTTSTLPLGVTHVTTAIEGSQTNVGDSPNTVTAYMLWNCIQDVTAFYVDVE